MGFLGDCPDPEKHPIDLWCIFSTGISAKKSQGAKYSQVGSVVSKRPLQLDNSRLIILHVL